MVYQEPTEHVQEYSDYVQKHGDPTTNGLGHSVVEILGLGKGVLIPTDRVWKVKRNHIQQVRREAVADDGTDMLGRDQISSKFNHASAMLMGSRAGGARMSLDQLLQHPASTSTAASTPSTSSPAAPHADASSADGQPTFANSFLRMAQGLAVDGAAAADTKLNATATPTPKKRGRVQRKGDCNSIGASGMDSIAAVPAGGGGATGAATGRGASPSCKAEASTRRGGGGDNTRRGRPKRDLLAILGKEVVAFE